MPAVIWRWLGAAIAIFATPYVVPGVTVDSFGAAAAMALVLGLLNVLVKPLLVVLTLPITFLTLGLFWLVINALIFQWAGHLVEGVHVATFGAAVLASLFVSVVSSVLFAIARVPGTPRVRVMWRRGSPGPFPPPGAGPGPRAKSPTPLGTEETIELRDNGKGKWE